MDRSVRGENGIRSDLQVTRRQLLAGLAGGTGATLLARSAKAQGTPTALDLSCPDLPGLQLWLDWEAGKSVIGSDELTVPADWTLFEEPGYSTRFRYPSDWTGSSLYSSGLTPDGAIVWRTTTTSTDYLFSARIESPDQRAIYEEATTVGGLLNVTLTREQAVNAVEQGVLGAGRATAVLCEINREVKLGSSTGELWIRGAKHEGLSIVTIGLVRRNQGSTPYTTLNWQSFVGPEDQFTDLMRRVFIPIVNQRSTDETARKESKSIVVF